MMAEIEGTTTAVDTEYGDGSGGWVFWAVLAVWDGGEVCGGARVAGRHIYVIQEEGQASSATGMQIDERREWGGGLR